jgi:hypothetical protein
MQDTVSVYVMCGVVAQTSSLVRVRMSPLRVLVDFNSDGTISGEAMSDTVLSTYRQHPELSQYQHDSVVYNISGEDTKWLTDSIDRDILAPIEIDVERLAHRSIIRLPLLEFGACRNLLLIDYSPDSSTPSSASSTPSSASSTPSSASFTPSSASSNAVPTVEHIPEHQRFMTVDNIPEQERPKVVKFTPLENTIASTSRTIPQPLSSLESILESILVKQEKDKPSLADLTENNIADTPTDIASAPEWMRSYVSDMKRRREIISSVRHVCESFQLARTLTYIQESRARDFDSVLSNPRTNEVQTQISRLFVRNDGDLICTNLGQNTNSRKEECASWHRASNLSCETQVWTETLFLRFLNAVYTAPFSQRSRYSVHSSLEM